MIKFIFSILFSAITLISYSAEKGAVSVNAVIGDLSFIHKFGQKPTQETDEILRIKTHLEFVEELLRNKRTSHLTASQKTSRKHLLDLLHSYWNAEIFPSNYEYTGRRISCFIDAENRICAVGYLIEQTAGLAVAEAINLKFKYSAILDMNYPLVDNWIASSGLTKMECAMIQPTYEFMDYNDPLPPVSPLVFYTGPSQKEIKLREQLDSQLVIADELHTTIDSLNLKLENTSKWIDSLQILNSQMETEMSQLETNSKAQKKLLFSVTWIMGSVIGAGLIFGLIKWLKPSVVTR